MLSRIKGPLAEIVDQIQDLLKSEMIDLLDIHPTTFRKFIAYEFRYNVPIVWTKVEGGRKDSRPWRELTKADIIEEILEDHFPDFIIEVAPNNTAEPVNGDRNWRVIATVYFLKK